MIKQLRKLAVILVAVLFFSTLAVFQGYAAPVLTPGGLLMFTSQWEFASAFPGLPMEDFEESTIGDTSSAPFARPLDSSTGNAYFSPGDILDGLIITASGTASPDNELRVAGGSIPGWNNTSKAVGNNNVLNVFAVEFSGPDVNAVGMDLVFSFTTGNAEIKVYTTGNTLVDTISSYALGTSPTFFGVYSIQPITRITMTKIPNDNWVYIDNIQFGDVTSNLNFYTGQAFFEAAHPGLPVEDFEESTIGDTAVGFFAEPLYSSSSNAYFSPGDILEGLMIGTVTPSDPSTSLVTVGGEYSGSNNTTKAIATHFSDDNLWISFPDYNAYAVGMDLMFRDSNDDAIIIVYNLLNKILGITTWSVLSSGETFFGLYSSDLISRIAILNNHRIEFADNIQFGGLPTGLTFYSTLADFRKVRANLPWEDFSESPVADNTTYPCDEPVDRTTSQAGCFAPGDILPNISLQTEDSLQVTCPSCVKVYGAYTGSLGNTTPMFAVEQPDYLEITFPGKNVHYVGMDHYSNGLISVYGENDTLLGTAVNDFSCGLPSLEFWGVSSIMPISRITFDGGGADPAYLNKIWFGGKFPWPSFMPAINRGNIVEP